MGKKNILELTKQATYALSVARCREALEGKKKKKKRVVRITDLKGEQGFCVIKIATVSMEDSRDVWDYL